MRHLIDITDLSVDEIESILDLADKMKANPAAYRDTMHGRILATLFFEPSTRTRLSFESAMLSLGGSVLGFSSADTSSATKGESLMDTIHTVSCYCDIIAMRHPKEARGGGNADFARARLSTQATADTITRRRR